tara:strand:+ start:1132 stop:1242 length:111 start_codon:yes stop_codon:yes gene_type:complete
MLYIDMWIVKTAIIAQQLSLRMTTVVDTKIYAYLSK